MTDNLHLDGLDAAPIDWDWLPAEISLSMLMELEAADLVETQLCQVDAWGFRWWPKWRRRWAHSEGEHMGEVERKAWLDYS